MQLLFLLRLGAVLTLSGAGGWSLRGTGWGLWLFFGCAVIKLSWKKPVSHHHLPNPRAALACVPHQVSGAEDQTALSLEECLRLLEATFPFGENSEVSGWGDGFHPSADLEAAAALARLLYPSPRPQTRR